MQSSFSGVRLESYMFTEESFRAVRERLKPDGLLVVYNYFRERWLVDRLANTAAVAFGQEPRVHVHEARAFLGVLMAGPRLAQLTVDPPVPDRVTAFGQSHEPATDDWPFLYLRDRHIPSHYLGALALILVVSVAAVVMTMRISKPSSPPAYAKATTGRQAIEPSGSLWSVVAGHRLPRVTGRHRRLLCRGAGRPSQRKLIADRRLAAELRRVRT